MESLTKARAVHWRNECWSSAHSVEISKSGRYLRVELVLK